MRRQESAIYILDSVCTNVLPDPTGTGSSGQGSQTPTPVADPPTPPHLDYSLHVGRTGRQDKTPFRAQPREDPTRTMDGPTRVPTSVWTTLT